MGGKTVAVIGGGAAGLVASITAAREGAEVFILERMNRVGKKILATGNGRCNLTNMYIDISRYHGKNPKFFYGAYSQFDVNKTMDFFEEIGIMCSIQDDGKVYPYSFQASSVLDVLRYEIERLNVKEVCDTEVKQIKPVKGGFVIITKDGRNFNANSVIVATGGKASPNLGSNGSGYDIAAALGHKIIEPSPALVQLRLNAPFLKAIKGVKFEGEASIEVDNKVLKKEKGEILYTDYGISGPPILQLSRTAVENINKSKKPFIVVDMFPDFESDRLEEIIIKRIKSSPYKPIDFSFVGLINKKMIPVILKLADIKDIHIRCGDLNENYISSIVKIMKSLKLEIIGTQSWTEAQVTAGGIDVSDINPKTLESKIVPNLYFAGEILDIDGDCGGFNLQWAWSSGYVAGYNAAQ
ncbi:NAD(P)/FAD-dependent oxidoreductase [Caloramator sp. E03]|uniref:NAD(P)/FAD-dependent oxidoreductase n=1 Tax=Caloramator sp. E03 TaxID=2576307 RepID=UPI0011106270|nr:NAD(P)/FAD-dependent oxidoreductase [Caloramator sp. E03]QCX32776.1 NAD(P)/FAD-dependent oxidoreductase [Caloramator sp. E03]